MAGTGETEDHSQPYGSSADANIGGDQPDRSVIARERDRHGRYPRHIDSEDSSNGARTHRSGRPTYVQHGNERSPSVQAHRHRTRGQLNESSHSLGASELEIIRRELEDTKAEMERKAGDFARRTHKLNGEIKRLEHEREELKAAENGMRQEIDSFDQQARRWQGEIKALEREREKKQEADRQLRQLLDARTRELRDAQSLLAKPDAISEADAVKMVQTLNDEIYQAAASWDRRAAGMRHHPKLREHQERLASVVGGPMVHMLSDGRMRDPNVDASMLVQIVLQVIMVVLCVEGSGRGTDRGAHWNSRIYFPKDGGRRFNQKLLTILKYAQRIRQAVGQSITSADLRVYVVFPAEKYDARSMDDAYGEAGNPAAAGSDVFGSVSLGMFRIIPRTDESQTLVKPQVVLGSTIRELLAYDEVDKKR
ncbi:hypothetical protein BD779DRAFT_1472567 [Infundibulicybe gibba]|nr:hypothetical protein BD779DRAFT_1472567 [Infundibulicybe gibba]